MAKSMVDTVELVRYSNNTLTDEVSSNLKEKAKMKRFNPETKTFKVFNALFNGRSLTPAQAKHDLGVGNLAAEASRIRANGYAVYANSRKAGNGVQVTEYVMGKPSREIVALGYKAKAAGMTL
jgi:hypothetical protein